MVAAVLVAGSEKAAAHRLGLSHSTVKHHLANARSKVGAETTAQLVWILGPRLPEPEGMAEADEQRSARRGRCRVETHNRRALHLLERPPPHSARRAERRVLVISDRGEPYDDLHGRR